ncbi:MAG: CinA family protein [Pseudomonadota bacterium]
MSELLAIVPDDVEEAAQGLLERACARQLSIVTAESCTGGLVASLLTDVEGASRAFERGFIVYTDDAKCELLSIDRRNLARWRAVSRETAIAMAEGALRRSHGDIAVAVTGFAGAAGPDVEPGLVHIACSRNGGQTRHREEHFGNIGRGPVRLRCLATAIDMLRKAGDETG